MKINQRKAVFAIGERVTFSAGALNGERSYWNGERHIVSHHEGMMSGDTYEQWLADCATGNVAYVVRSYYTPIAWYTKDRGWIVPQDRYSVTTSRHQGIVRRAVAEDQVFQERLAKDFARARVVLDQI